MSVKKFFATKDNTITNSFYPNMRIRAVSASMGASDIVELFSIYGQTSEESLEKTRTIIQFSESSITSARSENKIPASGSVEFFLRTFNAPHHTSTPGAFHITVTPLLQSWDEGIGLDMESYSDKDASNWVSCSIGVPWTSEGGTDSEVVERHTISPLTANHYPHVYEQYFQTGLEDLEVNITDLVESWLSEPTAATAEVTLTDTPTQGHIIKIYSPSGHYRDFHFHTASATEGNTVYVQIVNANPAATRNNFVTQVNTTSLFEATNKSTNAATIKQKIKGFYGNRKISLSDGAEAKISKQDFTGGTGVVNNGLLLKLSGSAESGLNKKSYYTKKFFGRGSEFFFKRPTIEARSSKTVSDDRGSVYRSSSLLPASENLNKVFLYNSNRYGINSDLPSTGSTLLVSFHSALGASSEKMSGPKTSPSGLHVTASRHSLGRYSAEFAYSGSAERLYDVWHKYTLYNIAEGTFTYTGVVADLNNGVKFTITDAGNTAHQFTFDTSTDTHAVDGANSTIGVKTAKEGSDINVISSQVNSAINASGFFTSTVSGSVVTIKQKVSGVGGNRDSSQDAGNVGFAVTNLRIPSGGTYETLVTGSGFEVNDVPAFSSNANSEYIFKLLDLKPSYTNQEDVAFRVFTRQKSAPMTIYTKAINRAAVSKVEEAYFKVTRIADNLEVIPYTTGSGIKYSQLSYDSSGSYFNLDMSILEPNYLYEISFLRKHGTNYIEQKEKYRFRLEK